MIGTPNILTNKIWAKSVILTPPALLTLSQRTYSERLQFSKSISYSGSQPEYPVGEVQAKNRPLLDLWRRLYAVMPAYLVKSNMLKFKPQENLQVVTSRQYTNASEFGEVKVRLHHTSETSR